MRRHRVLAGVAVAKPLLGDQLGLDEVRDARRQVTHTRRVVVRQDVALGVLDQLLVEVRLPTPLSLLIELAAKQAEQRRFHVRSPKVITRTIDVGPCGIAAAVEVLAGDDAHHPARQRTRHQVRSRFVHRIKCVACPQGKQPHPRASQRGNKLAPSFEVGKKVFAQADQ